MHKYNKQLHRNVGSCWKAFKLALSSCGWNMVCVFQKYTAVGELGKATDTLDASGSVTLEKEFGKQCSTIHFILLTYSCKPLFVLLRCPSVIWCFVSTEHITRLDIEEKLKAFTGDIMQVPPLWVRLPRVMKPWKDRNVFICCLSKSITCVAILNPCKQRWD